MSRARSLHQADAPVSAPSKPLNTVIDGLVFTLLDHAVFGTLRAAAAGLSEDSLAGRLKAFVDAIGAPANLPGELGRAFVDAGGFPIVLIAVVVGIGLGAVRYHGWDFRLLRLLRLTNRTGENLVWAETLTKSSGQAYALVACKDGSRFIGEIDTFSEEAGNFEILLSDASQVRPDGSLLPIHGEGVLLTRENDHSGGVVEAWRECYRTSRGQRKCRLSASCSQGSRGVCPSRKRLDGSPSAALRFVSIPHRKQTRVRADPTLILEATSPSDSSSRSCCG